MEKPTHDPSICVWKHGRWDCLHAIDADHFWYGDVMVDMNQLRFQRDSLNAQTARNKWWDVHERNSAVYMLSHYADYLANKPHITVKPEHAAKYLKKANEFGIPTGIKFD